MATRVAPDPARLREFAEVILGATAPVLIYGAAIARGSGWAEAVALAEALGAPVWAAPASERAPFPEDHPLYAGGLPFAQGPLAAKLAGHDVALVVGAPVFRYYPWAPGPYLPPGLRHLHIRPDGRCPHSSDGCRRATCPSLPGRGWPRRSGRRRRRPLDGRGRAA